MTETTTHWSGWDRAGVLCGAPYIVMINVGNTLETGGSTDASGDPAPARRGLRRRLRRRRRRSRPAAGRRAAAGRGGDGPEHAGAERVGGDPAGHPGADGPEVLRAITAAPVSGSTALDSPRTWPEWVTDTLTRLAGHWSRSASSPWGQREASCWTARPSISATTPGWRKPRLPAAAEPGTRALRELLGGVHLPVADGRHLLAVRARRRRRRPGVRVADLDPGRRDAPGRAGVRRAGQPLPGRRRALPVQQVLGRPERTAGSSAGSTGSRC